MPARAVLALPVLALLVAAMGGAEGGQEEAQEEVLVFGLGSSDKKVCKHARDCARSVLPSERIIAHGRWRLRGWRCDPPRLSVWLCPAGCES